MQVAARGSRPALFSAFSWFAWHAPEHRGGPSTALVFVGFSVLGVVLVVAALADTFVVDDAGVERVRFGRSQRIVWGEIARVTFPWGGPGIRLQSRGGVAIELAEMLEGFGLLCDELLCRAAVRARVEPEASACVLKNATLAPEPLQRAYVRWFEAEDDEPP